MLRTCPKARGFVLIDYLFATWLMSLLCFFILEAFSLGLWWTRTWEARAYAQKVLRHFAATGQKAPLLDPYLWVETERIVPELPQIKERQAAIYERPCRRLLARVVRYEKKIRALWPLNVCCSSFFSHSSSAFAQGPAGDLSRCHRSSYPAGNCAGQRWILTAALNIIFVMKHLLFPSKKGAPAMCWSYGPVPRIKRSSTMRRPRPNLEGKPFTSAPRKE